MVLLLSTLQANRNEGKFLRSIPAHMSANMFSTLLAIISPLYKLIMLDVLGPFVDYISKGCPGFNGAESVRATLKRLRDQEHLSTEPNVLESGIQSSPCEEPKKTPWGVECKNPSHDHYSREDKPFQVRGHWMLDSPSAHSSNCPCYDTRYYNCCLHHCSVDVAIATRHLLEADFEDVDPSFDLAEPLVRHESDVQESRGRCMITELPYEILRQILDHLVPSGCIYQFFPYGSSDVRVQAVQQMIRADAPYPEVAVLSLAATCRTMNERVCEILYGENEFIFNIAEGTILPCTQSSDFSQLEIWIRNLREHQGPRPLGPLTTRTVKSVKSASLIVVLPIAYTHNDGVARLRSMVQEAVYALEFASSMKRLGIDFGLPRTGSRDCILVSRVRVNINTKGRRLDLEISEPASLQAWREMKADMAVEPLSRLRKVPGVIVEGMSFEASGIKLTTHLKERLSAV